MSLRAVTPLFAAALASFALTASPSMAQTRVVTPVKPMPAPLATRSLAVTSPGAATGTYVQFQTSANLGYGTAPGQRIDLGMASTFQIQASTQPVAGAIRPAIQVAGTIQFSPNDRQANPLNTCYTTTCVGTLTITEARSGRMTVYTLQNATITQLQVGSTVNSVSFASNNLWLQRPTLPSSSAKRGEFLYGPESSRSTAVRVGLETSGDARIEAVGEASNYQLPVALSTASPMSRPAPVTGSIAFVHPEAEFGAVVECFFSFCRAPVLALYVPRGPNVLVYQMSDVTLNQVIIGRQESVSFTYSHLTYALIGPDGQTVAPHTPSEHQQPAAVPGATTVQEQVFGAPLLVLGRAATYNLQPIPSANGGGMSSKGGGTPAAGTIQFAAGEFLELDALRSVSSGELTKLIITDASSQQANVFTLGRVTLTQLLLGPTTTASFTYGNIWVQTFNSGGTPLNRASGWDYTLGQPTS